MTEPVSQPAAPPRTWRPIALWTAGILLTLALVWFVGTVVVPPLHTRAVVRGSVVFVIDTRPVVCLPEERIARLGKPEIAAKKLSTFCQLPWVDRNDKITALHLQLHCGACGIPGIVKALVDTDPNVRAEAATLLGDVYFPKETLPALQKASEDSETIVRSAAAEAMSKILGDGRLK